MEEVKPEQKVCNCGTVGCEKGCPLKVAEMTAELHPVSSFGTDSEN